MIGDPTDPNGPTVPGPLSIFQYGRAYLEIFSTEELRRMEKAAQHRSEILHGDGVILLSDIRYELERRDRK